MSREENKKIAEETIAIINSGCYRAGGKKIVFDRDKYSKAIVYPPEWKREHEERAVFDTKIIVSPLDTVSAILSRDNPEKTLALNFASARNPGGGFETGAQAQEEALARSGTLFLSIGGKDAREMYEANARCRNPFYSDYIVYSPEVLFFRDNDNKLLENGKTVAVISIPAVNRSICAKPDSEIEDVMRRRIRKLFDIALENGKDDLILGAWGCGVFGNNPETIARLFKKTLNEKPYKGAFKTVEFAILKGGRIDSFNIFKTVFSD